MSQCNLCIHAYWGSDGCLKCDIKPHDYQTRKQRSLAEWLRRNSTLSDWPTCPCFQHFNFKEDDRDS